MLCYVFFVSANHKSDKTQKQSQHAKHDAAKAAEAFVLHTTGVITPKVVVIYFDMHIYIFIYVTIIVWKITTNALDC